MIKLKPVDDAKALISDIRDKGNIKKILDHRNRKYGPDGWRPRSNKPQCIGCYYSDIHVASDWRGINELSVFCNKRMRIINEPYELCKERLEKPKVTIDKYFFGIIQK